MTGPRLVQFALLLAFWLALSGRYEPLFVGMGVASAALVTAMTGDLVARSLGPRGRGLAGAPRRLLRFAAFGLWVASRLPAAGAQVAFYVLHPSMPVRPGVLQFRTGLQSQAARALLANTVTVLPGTLTLYVDQDRFTVHAFVPQAADDLFSGQMQRRVARCFDDDAAAAVDPEARWVPVATTPEGP